MIDGTHVSISEFDLECEARDDAGRHFKGTGFTTCDLRDNVDVDPSFRRLFGADLNYDGDWGADTEYGDWDDVTPECEYESVSVSLVGGEELGLDPNYKYRVTTEKVIYNNR